MLFHIPRSLPTCREENTTIAWCKHISSFACFSISVWIINEWNFICNIFILPLCTFLSSRSWNVGAEVEAPTTRECLLRSFLSRECRGSKIILHGTFHDVLNKQARKWGFYFAFPWNFYGRPGQFIASDNSVRRIPLERQKISQEKSQFLWKLTDDEINSTTAELNGEFPKWKGFFISRGMLEEFLVTAEGKSFSWSQQKILEFLSRSTKVFHAEKKKFLTRFARWMNDFVDFSNFFFGEQWEEEIKSTSCTAGTLDNVHQQNTCAIIQIPLFSSLNYSYHAENVFNDNNRARFQTKIASRSDWVLILLLIQTKSWMSNWRIDWDSIFSERIFKLFWVEVSVFAFVNFNA